MGPRFVNPRAREIDQAGSSPPLQPQPTNRLLHVLHGSARQLPRAGPTPEKLSERWPRLRSSSSVEKLARKNYLPGVAAEAELQRTLVEGGDAAATGPVELEKPGFFHCANLERRNGAR